MMSVKSRLPQARSSKVPVSGNSSKLPQFSSSRAKPSLGPFGGKTLGSHHKYSINIPDNYKLTYDKPAEAPIVDLNANGGVVITDSDEDAECRFMNNNGNSSENINGYIPQSTDENCEIVSLCSVDPSPLKLSLSNQVEDGIVNFHNLGNYEESQFSSFELKEHDNCHLKQQGLMERHVSETSSTCSSISESNYVGNARMSKSKIKLNKQNKPVLFKKSLSENIKPSSLTNTSAAGPATKNNKSLYNRKGKLSLPPKPVHISASNAMDYVKRITSQNQLKPSNETYRTQRLKASRQPTSNLTNHKKPLKISTFRSHENQQNGREWSKDINSAVDFHQGNTKLSSNVEVASASSIRAETKKLQSEKKVSSVSGILEKKTNDTSSIECKHEEFVVDEAFLFGSKKSVGENRKQKSPRIARPVIRPPRQRTKKPPQKADEKSGSGCPRVDIPNEEDQEEVCNLMGRLSITTSPEKQESIIDGKLSRESSHSQLTQHATTVNGVSSLEAGDTLAADIIRRKERWKENEALERRSAVIRSNSEQEKSCTLVENLETEEEDISSTHGTPDSFLGKTGVEVGNENSDEVAHAPESKVKGREAEVLSNVEVKSCCSALDSLSTTSGEASLHEFDDLPSLNSTAMMGDYSVCSNTSNTSHVQVTYPGQSCESAHGSELKASNFGEPSLHSSLPDNKAVSDDECCRAPLNFDLSNKLDEVAKENRMIKSQLQDLYEYLENEEELKSKMKLENERLRNKNALLNEEVNRLTRILEMSQSSPSKLATHKQASTCDADSQTEKPSKVWYKTQLSSARNELNETLKHINNMCQRRQDFDESIEVTKRKLQYLLEETSQT